MHQLKLPPRADDSFDCPHCASRVHWGCRSTRRSNVGYAYCSRSPTATRVLVPGAPMAFCEWEGKCVRRADGKVEIFYLEEIQEKK